MATKKGRPAAAPAAKAVATKAVATKAVAGRATARSVAQPAAMPAQTTGNSQRLLREAAWSRMFGRANTKNPFAG